MDELGPQELEELVQELKEEDGAQESPSQEVEELVRTLQHGNLYLARQEAAEQLGKVGTTSDRIVRALIAAYESDSFAVVSEAAARSLHAFVHQTNMEKHPVLMKAAKKALRRRPPSHGDGGQTELERSLKSTGSDLPVGVLAWAAGVFLGYGRQLKTVERKYMPILLLAALSPVVCYQVGVLVGSHMSRSVHVFSYSLLDIAYGKYLSLNLLCCAPGLALSLFLGWLVVATAQRGKLSKAIVAVLISLGAVVTLAVGYGVGVFMNLDLSRY